MFIVHILHHLIRWSLSCAVFCCCYSTGNHLLNLLDQTSFFNILYSFIETFYNSLGFGLYGIPNICWMLSLARNCLNSLLVNSFPLSLWIMSGLLWVANQLFKAFIVVCVVLSAIHQAQQYLEKWSTIVNKYLISFVAIMLASWTRSIWNFFNDLLLLMWCWTFPLHIFPEVIC